MCHLLGDLFLLRRGYGQLPSYVTKYWIQRCVMTY